MANLDLKPEHAIEVANQFQIKGHPNYAVRNTRGHINDTFEVETDAGVRYVLQRIEDEVFHHPVEIMHNIRLALEQVHASIAKSGGDQQALTLVYAQDGLHYTVTGNGECWRCYDFIEGDVYDLLPGGEEGQAIAREAAKAFGTFQIHLSGLNPGRLYEAIPNFHNQPWRFKEFNVFLDADRVGRVAGVRPEIGFILDHEYIPQLFEADIKAGNMPLAVTHADNKLNNVAFVPGAAAPRALAVFDLDTIGQGYRLHDLGDLLRTGICAAAEDERDLGKVRLNLGLYDAIINGYMEAVGDILTPAEKTHLIDAGLQLTFEMAMRFLGRYLDGDTYFAVHRKGQNVDRARTQIALIKQMEEQRDELQRIVDKHVS